MSIENVKIKPMKVYFGTNTAQVQAITCKADVSSSLSAKYFLFMDPAGAKYYAWIDTGSSVDPAPAGGWVGHSVVISPNASASAVATALAAVLTAVTGFDATASGAIVTLTCTANGYAQPAYDVNTGFAFKVLTLGATKYEVGCIQGDIELTGLTQTKTEVTCHATGTTVRKEIISGYEKPTMSFTLQETDKESIKKLFIMLGMKTFTPVGADKSELFGYGPANVGGENPKVKITMHPVELDDADVSEDWHVWKAEVGADSFVFSGTEVATIPATFTIYPDESKKKDIQFFMIGDETQLV